MIKTANEMLGKRARVKSGDYGGVEGIIDRVTQQGSGTTVRLIVARTVSDIYVDANHIDYCQCGAGGGCYLCAEKPANGFPRRLQMYRFTAAELAIFKAVEAVEAVGADPLLTDAVNMLQQAREKVADYVDRK